MHLLVKGPKEGIINLSQISNKISGEFDLSIDEDKEHESDTSEIYSMQSNNASNISNQSREQNILYRLRVKDPSILLSSTYGILVKKEIKHSPINNSISSTSREEVDSEHNNVSEDIDCSKSSLIAGTATNEYLCPTHHLILRANTDILKSGKLSNLRVEYIEVSNDEAKKLMSAKKLTKDSCGHFFTDSEYKILYVRCTLAENGTSGADSSEHVSLKLNGKANELENLELDQSAVQLEND